MRPTIVVLIVLLILGGLLVKFKNSTRLYSQTPPKLIVVSTVSPLTNIIYNIGGDKISLTGIIPEGTDSHTFEPTPRDAILLSRADIIFLNGAHLETPTKKLAQANKKADGEIVELAEQTISETQWVFDFSFPKDRGDPNPHLWLNPLYALRYAEIVKDALTRRDGEHAASYQQNFSVFKSRIVQLDGHIKEAIATIPQKNRKLVTYHDSFAYFARRYSLTVIAAIQPADFSEPAPRDIANLITQLKTEGVPAIFGSEVFPSQVLARIGEEADVVYVDTLADDDLPGNPGDLNHSYIAMLVNDVVNIVRSLGGDPSALKVVNITNIPGPEAAR